MSVALAEPRRKEKYGPDPRNTFWSKDETKFGFRMLQNMGWKKGKGLGAKETGMTEHLKAGNRKNDDVRGFGCSKKHADNWIAHQDDFESILASLNESADTSDRSSQPSESTKASHAMEEKSRSSRSRVHYHKFIQSKDLSTRSAEDLNCIFGRRKKPSEKSAASTTSEANGDDNSSSDDQKNDSSVTEDVPIHGVKTIISSCSVQEYFAMKMAELQRKMKPATTTDTDVPTESNCNDSDTALSHCNKSDGKSGPDGADVGASEDSGLTEKQKRKKKKKKHRQENQENDVSHEGQVPEKSGDNSAESCQEPNPVCVDEQLSKSEKKEKRKKKRGSSERDSVNGSQPVSAEEPEAELSHEAQPTAKKAKKRKSAELDAAATEQEKTSELGQNGICEDSDEATQKKKKKKKKKQKKEEEEEDAHNSSILRQENDGKNRRRKSVRFSTGTAEIFMIPNKEDEKAEQEEEETVSKKQSKKRKRQKANAEEETETSLSADSQPTAESAQEDQDESLKEEDHIPKKKKRKTEKNSKKKSKAQKENQENPEEQSAESEQSQSVLTSSSVDTVKEGRQTESENPVSVDVPHWKKPKSSKKDVSQEQVDRICKSFIGSNLSSIKGYGNWS